jgi:hypothetical protein
MAFVTQIFFCLFPSKPSINLLEKVIICVCVFADFLGDVVGDYSVEIIISKRFAGVSRERERQKNCCTLPF